MGSSTVITVGGPTKGVTMLLACGSPIFWHRRYGPLGNGMRRAVRPHILRRRKMMILEDYEALFEKIDMKPVYGIQLPPRQHEIDVDTELVEVKLNHWHMLMVSAYRVIESMKDLD
ncbi:uncharacterized protein LOC113333456 [Papaver somniferum]|uniref:uncharacterized protein LOC113333456 n=1 Tax=Papaver somniferum TaxID=3469 RepID=UPI000E6FD301|nr:uncharacterized protein LOC113333456 [Papaver somniferum]